LDVTDNALSLTEPNFKYNLNVQLPFKVNPDSAQAKFDVKSKTLSVTVKVVAQPPKIQTVSSSSDSLADDESVPIEPAVEKPAPKQTINPDIVAHNLKQLEKVSKELEGNSSEQSTTAAETKPSNVVKQAEVKPVVTAVSETKPAQPQPAPVEKKPVAEAKPQQAPIQPPQEVKKPVVAEVAAAKTQPQPQATPIAQQAPAQQKQEPAKPAQYPLEYFSIDLTNKYIYEID